ncbi:DNA-(apurinic or apyrimidinic site) lyase /endonuclease III [Paracoccus chinensis]|uniref:Endonuclease III n=1 Tax=Paracoccus chinensis TaxID=525640 RepID=A0A1G9GD43_9RHOB|nr:endonuclease III [Paracoccus chinensis]SDK98599.1 DNA-(apurinic or apyrimidinic site) lyase /endonuclease III [Paracoccus chinensis]
MAQGPTSLPPTPRTRRAAPTRVAAGRLPPPLPYAEQVAIFSILQAGNPRPVTELQYRDAFTLLVAVALSAQATDVGVNKATPALFDAAPTPQAMVALGVEGVTEHIKTIGLFRQKAKNVVALSQRLVEEFGGEVPTSRAALMSLPGVGRKTANVVLNSFFGIPAQAVDTHIFRVGNRTRIAPGRDESEVERAIEDNVPAEFQQDAHHWLILHGRYVCQARRPRCTICPIRAHCPYEPKTTDPV